MIVGPINWSAVDDPRVLICVFIVGFLLALSKQAATTWTSWEMFYWQVRLGIALQLTVGFCQYIFGLSGAKPLMHFAYVPVECALALGAASSIFVMRLRVARQIHLLHHQIAAAKGTVQEIKSLSQKEHIC